MTNTQIQSLINAIDDGGENTASEVRDILNALKNESCKLFEIKKIGVNLTTNPNYLTDNFDNTGLGIDDMEGFAIANGLNGTFPHQQRTAIGYDAANYPIPGATGGSKDAVVGAHTHGFRDTLFPQDGAVTIDYSDGNEPISTGTNKPGTAGDNNNDVLFYKNRTTSSAGVSLTDKNMQPYIVVLFIQRIA